MPLTYEEDAVREQVWLRAFLMGPTGSGKSRGALELASRIFDGKLRTTLINTERGRGKMYADRYRFDYLDLSEDGDYSPAAYIRAVSMAEQKNRGGVIVIDSVSHEWMGAGGILSQADRFGDWKVVRPKHNEWVERLMALDAHLIVTVRAKMKYEVGEEEQSGRKRQVIRMLGVGPIQSDDLQYEFNLVGRFEQETHDVTWSGHIDPLIDTVSNLGDDEGASAVATQLTRWLSEGNPPPEPPEAASGEAVEELVEALKGEGYDDEQIERGFARARQANRGVLTPEYVKQQLDASRERTAPAATPDPAAEPEAETSEDDLDKAWSKSGEAAPAKA